MELGGWPNTTQQMTLERQNETANELALKYGSISVIKRILRQLFAPHCADGEKLSEVLADLDEASLTQLVRDYKSGRPEKFASRSNSR